MKKLNKILIIQQLLRSNGIGIFIVTFMLRVIFLTLLSCMERIFVKSLRLQKKSNERENFIETLGKFCSANNSYLS